MSIFSTHRKNTHEETNGLPEVIENTKRGRGQRGKGKGVRRDYSKAIEELLPVLLEFPDHTNRSLAAKAWPGEKIGKKEEERVRRIIRDLERNPEKARSIVNPEDMQDVRKALEIRKESKRGRYAAAGRQRRENGQGMISSYQLKRFAERERMLGRSVSDSLLYQQVLSSAK